MTEDQLEQETLGWLAEVGYRPLYGPDLAPDGPAPERADYRQVLLPARLRRAIDRLNPSVPTAARDDAFKQVVDLGTPSLLVANRHFHRLLVHGVPVQYQKDGETRGTLFGWSIGLTRRATNGWRSTSFQSPGGITRAGRTSSCSSTACRWC